MIGIDDKIYRLPSNEARLLLKDPRTIKVFHNATFDLHMLREAGYAVHGPIEDTMILAHLAGQERLGLKQLAKTVLYQKIDEKDALDEWMKKERALRRKAGAPPPTYEDVPEDLIKPYLSKDVDYTRSLYQRLHPKIKGLFPKQYKMECALIPIILRMEQTGMRVNVPYLRELSEKTSANIETISAKIKGIRGEEFNHRSPKQLLEYIEGRGLPILGTTEKGNPKLDSTTLAAYKDPLLDAILYLRKVEKIRTTYYEGILDAVDKDGVLHPTFRQNGARTGRFSCASPNLQNIPAADLTVRKALVPRPGKVFLLIDYNNIEMRILAHYTKDERMIKAFLDGADLHQRTADMLRCDRKKAKAINFGIAYGMGVGKLSNTLGIPLREARDLLRRYHHIYPHIRPLMKDLESQIKYYGYIHDDYGKRYHVNREFCYKGLNYLIQGTAAQVMKKAMLRLMDCIRDKDVRLLNIVHDEFILEADKKILDKELVNDLKYVLEDDMTFSVPLPVEVMYGEKSWGEKTEEPCL